MEAYANLRLQAPKNGSFSKFVTTNHSLPEISLFLSFFSLSKNLKSSKGIRKARSSKNNIKKFQETIAAELAEQLAAQLARLFASQLAKRCSGSTLQCLHKRPLLRSSFAAVPTE